MDAKRILLVDDDARLALRLESEGYDVVAAASGEEALERLGESRPGFVLAALRMPGMGGIELLARIQERYPGLPVALISTQDDIPDAVRAAQAGGNGGGLPSFDEARAEFARSYLRQVLELAGGNISQAARLAGRNRTDLYKLLHRYGIKPRAFRDRLTDLFAHPS